jgi:hypothetical protein
MNADTPASDFYVTVTLHIARDLIENEGHTKALKLLIGTDAINAAKASIAQGEDA